MCSAHFVFVTILQYLITHFSDFQLACLGSFFLHESVFFLSGLPCIYLERAGWLSKYKIQVSFFSYSFCKWLWWIFFIFVFVVLPDNSSTIFWTTTLWIMVLLYIVILVNVQLIWLCHRFLFFSFVVFSLGMEMRGFCLKSQLLWPLMISSC